MTLIDKWKLLEYIEDEIRYWGVEYEMTDVLADIEDFQEVKLPDWHPFSLDDKTTWPEKGHYMVTSVPDMRYKCDDEEYYVESADFDTDDEYWYDESGWGIEVVAYREFPKPFKGG